MKKKRIWLPKRITNTSKTIQGCQKYKTMSSKCSLRGLKPFFNFFWGGGGGGFLLEQISPRVVVIGFELFSRVERAQSYDVAGGICHFSFFK